MSAPSAALEGFGKCHSLLSSGLASLSACEPRACKPRCVRAPCALSGHILCLEVPVQFPFVVKNVTECAVFVIPGAAHVR